MTSIAKALGDEYKEIFRKRKSACPQIIQFIVDQFVAKGWMTDVEYYVGALTTIVCGKTNMHHDVFYNSPLTKILFDLGCHVAPNKHCKDILGEGYIVIEVPDNTNLYAFERSCHHYDYKGIDAFANAFDYFIHEYNMLKKYGSDE